jgi:integrase
MSLRVPTYRLKKVRRRKYAIVSLPDGAGGRRDILLGKYGSRESQAEYARIIAEWQAGGRRLPPEEEAKPDLTVNELALAFLRHAEQHYRHPDGTPTSEMAGVKASLRPLLALYGHTPATAFGPLALRSVRQKMIEGYAHAKFGPQPALCRRVCNQRTARIVRMFKWAVSHELIPETVHRALATVQGLQRGRSEARETEPIQPVSLELVEDTLPHLLPTVADLLSLQLLTGARSGEICVMRGCDIDMSGSVWLYQPYRHKTEYRGKGRVIVLGPRAQEIVKRYLKANVEAYLFSPREAMQAWRETLRRQRKSRVQPSQVNRKKRRPRCAPGERYCPGAIALAVRRACRKAGLPFWHPHQLRHAKATEIRREFGVELARVVLGHSSLAMTELYAEVDRAQAMEVIAKIG